MTVGSASILVVDDERKIRDFVRSYLELEGYSVLVADTGGRALESASRSEPDLVVLDLGLADLPGEEPHVYGPIDVEAVTAVWPFEPGSNGRFQLPTDMLGEPDRPEH